MNIYIHFTIYTAINKIIYDISKWRDILSFGTVYFNSNYIVFTKFYKICNIA